jgi:hypothetical protein
MSADDWERKIAAPQNRCVGCEAPFSAGAAYVATLHVRDGKMTREDRCESCAETASTADPPLATWRSKIAEPTGPISRRLDFDTLSELLPRLVGKEDEASARLAWIVALLLLRKKLLLIESKTIVDGAEEMTVKFKHDDRLFRVRDPKMDEAATARLHEELASIFDLGGASAAPSK